MPDWAAFINEF